MTKRHARAQQHKVQTIDSIQDMVGTQVTLFLTDGSHIIEEPDGSLAGFDEFGVTLHKPYRNQLRVTFHPWPAVFKIAPQPLNKREAQHTDDD